jgi:parvulin-like peptidyl-prolyl isomerase
MLRFMRKYATGYLVKGLFGIIIVVFIFWGVGSFRGGEKVVAEVGPYKISIIEYQESYNRLLNFYKMLYKDKLDDAVLNQLKIKEKAINELVDKYVLLLEAKEMGLNISDREFSEYIANIDAFKRDGKFDQSVYAEILKRNNIDPKNFEVSEKSRLLTSKLINVLNDNSVFISEGDAWISYTEAKGEINLFYTRFDPASFKDKVTVNDKEIEDIYEKEKDRHKSENVYRLKYIVIDEKSPVKDDAAYLDLLKAKDITEYAKQKGLEVVDVGATRESELIKKFKGLKIEEWLKGLKKGDISLPARDAGRSYIFQLVDAEGGKPIDKNIVLKEIKERIVKEKTKLIAKTEAEAEINKKIADTKNDTGLIPRNSTSIPKIGVLPPEHAGVLALTKEKWLYEKPVDISGIYYVFKYKGEKQPGKDEWEKDKKSYIQYVFMKKREEYYKGLIEDLKKKQKIEIHWKEI